jgi:hypothetical protein
MVKFCRVAAARQSAAAMLNKPDKRWRSMPWRATWRVRYAVAASESASAGEKSKKYQSFISTLVYKQRL